MSATSAELSRKLGRLRGIFAPMRSVMVAFSGGVDSTFVLRVAHDVLGARMLALTTTSPTMPNAWREVARIRILGHWCKISSISSATAFRTCSQLSKMSNARLRLSDSTIEPISGRF